MTQPTRESIPQPDENVSPRFGRAFGKIMQQHPDADARLVNDILRIAWAEAAAPALDVERLGTAIRMHVGWDTAHPGKRCGRKCAPDIAAEYARLSTDPEPPA